LANTISRGGRLVLVDDVVEVVVEVVATVDSARVVGFKVVVSATVVASFIVDAATVVSSTVVGGSVDAVGCCVFLTQPVAATSSIA
jgi:hypothetical protein